MRSLANKAAPQARLSNILKPHPEVPVVLMDIILIRLGEEGRILAQSLSKEWVVAAQSNSTLQDTFLKHLSDNNVDVTIFLGNGIRLQGRVKRFDNFMVLLVRGNSSQVIYKHAISTIHPAEPIELMDPTSFK